MEFFLPLWNFANYNLTLQEAPELQLFNIARPRVWAPISVKVTRIYFVISHMKIRKQKNGWTANTAKGLITVLHSQSQKAQTDGVFPGRLLSPRLPDVGRSLFSRPITCSATGTLITQSLKLTKPSKG